MCRTQCVLALVALSVGLAHSWDIAVTTGQKLEFYTNNTKTDTEGVQLRDFTALAYDAVHNMLLFVDKKRDNASIFSFNIATKKYQSLVRRSSYVNIKDIAFDPVKAMLFWIDSEEKSIFWISMKPGSKNDVYGNLLIKMDDEIPRAIAVDSCRGYIYWTNVNITKPTIERARFDGTERQVLIDTNIYKPVSLAVDQQTKKIYWADDREGIHYSIESADLNGMNRMTMLLDENHQPNALTISKDSIYWVDLDHKSVWQLPKNASNNEKPTQIISFNDEPFGIAANYTIEDQTQGNSECEALTALPRNNSLITDSGVADDVGLFCVHGIKLDGKSHCKCTPGYIGDRCDISVCQNYCFQGDCSIKDDGQPKCRCAGGYSGERCEINACHGYCLNYGACSLNEKDGPVCQCIGDYEGSRCEAVKVFTTTTEPLVKIDSNESHVYNNTKEIPSTQRTLPSNMFNEEELIESTSGGWDPVRDPVIMVLGIVCGLLCLACAVLFTKILQLRRRPRIKKRIIVNKNVTPMTARPDQCEITIENCCNMNICETPCFEPRSTIRPSLLDSKPGKEEKKNLIANMEYPDDPY